MQRIIYIIICLLPFGTIKGQTKNTSGHEINDTFPASSMTTFDLIRQATTQSLNDSLTMAILREQLNSLNKNDARQRSVLEKRLQALEQADSIRNTRVQRQIDSLKQCTQGIPVILGTDTLYHIYTHMGSFTPRERAASITEHISRIAKIFSPKHDTITIQDNGYSSELMFKDQIIMGITDIDARWFNKDRSDLAEEYRDQLKTSITQYQKDSSLFNILKQIGLCLLVICLQYMLIKGVNYFFKKTIDNKLRSKKDEWFTGIRIRTFEILDSGRQVNAILFISRLIRYLINLLQLYITIPILFSIFPVTQRLAETLFGWILTPVASIFKGFVNYLPKLFMIIIIFIITRYIVRFARYIMKEVETGRLVIPGFYPDWSKATFNILRLFLYAFMLVMIFPLLPSSDTEIFKGVSVFIGVIFSLGSSSVIANMVAGMVITYMRPFRIGDRIKIGEITGDVIEKSPFVTRIKTHKNEIITVPNSTILSSSVVNYSSSASENGLILHTTVTIGYDAPWREVHQILIKAATQTTHILKDPSPFVLQTALNDFYVSYELCAYTKDAGEQASIYSELHQNIQDCFNEAGIEIMSPHYRAVRDGNQCTIPQDKTH